MSLCWGLFFFSLGFPSCVAGCSRAAVLAVAACTRLLRISTHPSEPVGCWINILNQSHSSQSTHAVDTDSVPGFLRPIVKAIKSALLQHTLFCENMQH